MSGAYPAPILIGADGRARTLQRVPLERSTAEGAYSEDDLQALLFAHPDALPIADIDSSFAGLVPVCREMNTPAGPIDVLYCTPSGRLAIVEAKLWRNPEARRKVIGQILDYAKELSRWNYEQLDAAVRRARRASADAGEALGLADVIRAHAADFDEARFVDAVAQSLRRGDLLLLIIGDGIREGVGAITEFLEGHGTLHFTFGLVELAIHGLPDGGRLIQPRVLARSAIIRRTVISVDGPNVRVADTADGPEADGEATVSPELEAARARFTTFWSAFLADLRLDDASQPVGPPNKSTNQYFYMPRPSNAWVSAYLAQGSQEAGVYLAFGKGALEDRLFQALVQERPAINRVLGDEARWDTERRRVIVTRRFAGDLADPARTDVRPFLIQWTNRFITEFRPRIARLLSEQG
ncbi:MAG: hypothetical protein KJ067_10805 [Vicinamibacteria bacterium]|nr:hypothetical protein [Vicinamibacteria bacterium]